MKKLYLLLIPLFIISLVSSSVNNCSADSVYVDGSVWKEFSSETEKVTYVLGFLDGINSANAFLISRVDDNDLIKKQINELMDFYGIEDRSNLQQIVDGLNEFYSNYANQKIPAFLAYVVILKRMRGFPEAELQKEIEGLRQASSELDSTRGKK